MKAVRRLLFLLGLFALGNMLAVGGGVGYLVAQGKLDAERVRAVVEVFQNTDADEAQSAESSEPVDASARPSPAMSLEQREIARLNLERVTREADDRLKYANLLMLDVERRREAFEKQKEVFAQAQQEEVAVQSEETFQKDLEVLSLLKPKIALDSLLVRPVDEAARLMMAMDGRTSKKIIEAASKEPRKWAAMLEIQRQMRAEPDVDGAAQAQGAR